MSTLSDNLFLNSRKPVEDDSPCAALDVVDGGVNESQARGSRDGYPVEIVERICRHRCARDREVPLRDVLTPYWVPGDGDALVAVLRLCGRFLSVLPQSGLARGCACKLCKHVPGQSKSS